jgi:hypothetical protein
LKISNTKPGANILQPLKINELGKGSSKLLFSLEKLKNMRDKICIKNYHKFHLIFQSGKFISLSTFCILFIACGRSVVVFSSLHCNLYQLMTNII